MAKTLKSGPKAASKIAGKAPGKPASKSPRKARVAMPSKPKTKPKTKPAPAELKLAKTLKAKFGKTAKAQRKSAKVAAALPIPASIPIPEALVRPRAMAAGAGALAPFTVEGAEAAILDKLWRTVESRRNGGDVTMSHSARLMARGTAKVAQKLGEEAVECVIEATLGNRGATVLESADLLYHLIVVWVDAGIEPSEVWAELARRQGISGIAEKASRPKALVRAARTTKLP